MNKTKLEVIRINEDVIATSGCDNAVVYYCYSPYKEYYNSDFFSTAKAYSTWNDALSLNMEKMQKVMKFVSENGAEKHYHMDINGNIKLCDNPQSHVVSPWVNSQE